MNKSMLVRVLQVMCSIFISNYTISQVVINEYSCSNIKRYTYVVDTFYYDPDSINYEVCVIRNIDSTYCFFSDNFDKTEDWIEIYNSAQTPVDISGYYLSDNPEKPKKYRIPTTYPIPSEGYRLIWASGRDTMVDGTLHAGFKLTQTGEKAEYIFMSDAAGQFVDSLRIIKTQSHHSCGRTANGSAEWAIFPHPTPGTSNNDTLWFSGYSRRPEFSQQAGFYAGPITISMDYDSDSCSVYYTLDGTEPDSTSILYTGAIVIDSTTVLKAISIPESHELLPGFINYATYFINEDHTIPVVSIAGTLLDSLATGWKDCRPWGSIEYFDKEKNLITSSYGEFNSHGQDSWRNDQRSLDFVAKDQLGYSGELIEKFFEISDRTHFQRLILRAAGDDNYPATIDGIQSDWNLGSAHMRDAYFQNLCKTGGMSLDVRKASKCVVYLNGTYWGVYDIREIPDDHDYTKYYYNQDEFDLQYILTWGETWAQYGGDKALADWDELRRFILNHDMAQQENFDRVTSELDVQSLTDYVIGHSISVSSDWLIYNTGWWRGLNPEGEHKKWGYILWDNDASFAFYTNYTGIPDTSATAALCNVDGLQGHSDPEKHILILNKLRQNSAFNNYFIMRYNDLLNTAFSCEHMLHQLDSMRAVLEPEMMRHTQRWPGGSYAEWQKNADRLRYFIERRCGARADSKLDSCYNLTGPYDITFDIYPEDGGSVDVNSLRIHDFPWNATYFGGADLNLAATPDPANNYYFHEWTSASNSFLSPVVNQVNSVQLESDDLFTAVFSHDPNPVSAETPINPEDWITLYPTWVTERTNLYLNLQRPTKLDVKMTGMAGNTFTLFSSEGKTLPAGNYNIEILPAHYTDSPGMYLIQAITGNGSYTLKMIYKP